jgi:hypothetical protein
MASTKKKPRRLQSKKLVIYLHKKSRSGLEEGTVFLCSPYGKILPIEEHFDSLDDIGVKIRRLFTANGIKWP